MKRHNNLAVVYMQTGRLAEADAEIKAAEKTGFRVNPQLKEDLKKASRQAADAHAAARRVRAIMDSTLVEDCRT